MGTIGTTWRKKESGPRPLYSLERTFPSEAHSAWMTLSTSDGVKKVIDLTAFSSKSTMAATGAIERGAAREGESL